jgi:hypothetical protein
MVCDLIDEIRPTSSAFECDSILVGNVLWVLGLRRFASCCPLQPGMEAFKLSANLVAENGFRVRVAERLKSARLARELIPFNATA